MRYFTIDYSVAGKEDSTYIAAEDEKELVHTIRGMLYVPDVAILGISEES